MMKFFFKILDAYDRLPEPRRFWTFFGVFIGLFLIVPNIIAIALGKIYLSTMIGAILISPIMIVRILHLQSGHK